MSDYEQGFPPVGKTFSTGPAATGQAQQSCVSTSTAEHEAEQKRLAERTRTQQEANRRSSLNQVIEIDETGKVHAESERAARDLADLRDESRRRSIHRPFADRPIVDQIEALRREVLQLRAANTHLHNLFSTISAQLQNLRQHEHVNGKVMVPADSFGHPPGLIQGMSQAGSSYDPLV